MCKMQGEHELESHVPGSEHESHSKAHMDLKRGWVRGNGGLTFPRFAQDDGLKVAFVGEVQTRHFFQPDRITRLCDRVNRSTD